MYNSVKLAGKFLKYWFTSSNAKGHGIHSPFVFDLIQNVLNSKEESAKSGEIEKLREELLKNKTQITITDLGAGSRNSNHKVKTISNIASTALKPKRYNRLLYNLIQHYDLKSAIELGTSLGISSAYMASTGASVATIEGDPAIAEIADQNFKRLNLPSIRNYTGNFDDLLETAIADMGQPDFVFIDGNHRFEPTLRYFHTVLPHLNFSKSVLVFDDIHWSEEMEKAWAAIQQHPQVMLSVDLFFVGLVFFFKDNFREKQSFSVRY